jgi:hypothetical protein
MPDENLVSTNGAKTRKLGIEYRLVPREGLRRLALRYTLGLHYGENNWKKGLLDKEFLDERKNHMIEHLFLYLEEGNGKDDNLAAVVWGCFALMEAEKVQADANREAESQAQTVRPVA